MYWLSPGRVFTSQASVVFAGVHNMQSQVYFAPGQPAAAIWIDQEAKKRMEISCKEADAIYALEKLMDRIGTLRVVRGEDHGTHRYCGDWMITDITKLAGGNALISLLGVFPAWS
ncbi:TPA: hypothetical protein ACH3X2_001955 [Trebouxia sp. C0005]